MWPFSSTPSKQADGPPPAPDACPIDHSRFPDAAASYPSIPARLSARPEDLPKGRVVSSIPRYRAAEPASIAPSGSTAQASTSTATCPAASAAAPESTENWVYPSPSQFHAALQRKNRAAEARDMYTVVPIHNAVNERVWQQILEWEAGYGNGSFDKWPRSGKTGPMLCSFVGRAGDRSPRAWMKVLSGYQAPFDRHDWEIIRPNEQKMRYVIDFYPGKGADSTSAPGSGPNLAFYIDIRPALDGWEGVRMRMLKGWDEVRTAWAGQRQAQPPARGGTS